MSAHILFVDDEAPIRELLSIYFRKKGFDVTTATTSAEARAAIDQRRFDAAIIDVNLAGQNGLELLNLIRKKHGKVPIIIFTGLYSDPHVVEQARAAGADGILPKGEPLEKLYSEVTRHLPASAPVPGRQL